MLFNKINFFRIWSVTNRSETYIIEDHITIIIDKNDDIGIYIDDIYVCYCTYSCNGIIPTYFYKIPYSIVRKINKWSKMRVNEKLNQKKKIEQHFKDLYK